MGDVNDQKPSSRRSRGRSRASTVQKKAELPGGIYYEREQTQKVFSYGLKLINRFTIEDLEKVEQGFFVHDEDGERPLDLTREEFVMLLALVVEDKGTVEEFNDLFDKVDFCKEEFITWDKLCSFILLEYYEIDNKVASKKIPQWKELKAAPSKHKSPIVDIVKQQKSSRLCSVSRNGLVSFWNRDWNEVRQEQISTCSDNLKQKDLWVTHFTFLDNINKLAVTLTSKEIMFFDLSPNNDFECSHRLTDLEHTALCIDYWYNPRRSNLASLCFGDVAGYVHVIHFTDAIFLLFDRPVKTSSIRGSSCTSITLKGLSYNQLKSCKYYKHKSHKEWTRHVAYAAYLECFISVSTSSINSIVLNWVDKDSGQMRVSSFDISQGVNGFDYSQKLNTIATAGINHRVCLWNPFVLSKPIGVLRGHMQSVRVVLFMANTSLLLSLAKDKVMRLWDTHLQICLQRISGILPRIGDLPVALHFDREIPRLVVALNEELLYMDAKVEAKNKILTHTTPVTASLFVEETGQLVTACTGSVVTIWMIGTGQKVKQFANAHGCAEVISLAHDVIESRFLTGSTDGTIKVWDFTGHCFRMLVAANGEPCDISQIIVLKSCILAIGWSKVICRFLRNQFDDFHCYPVPWQGEKEHGDDIVTIASTHSHYVITASVDNKVIVWNMSTESAVRVLNLSLLHSVCSAAGQSEVLDDPRPVSCTMAFVCKVLCLNNTPFSDLKYANLVCAFTNGKVQFWNAMAVKLHYEIEAHQHCSSVTIATNSTCDLLASGDSSGECKIWNMPSCCGDGSNTRSTSMTVMTTARRHTDAVTSLTFIDRAEHRLIVSASLDLSVCVHNMNGLFIGTFGQNEHWNLFSLTTRSPRRFHASADVKSSALGQRGRSSRLQEEKKSVEEDIKSEFMRLKDKITFPCPSKFFQQRSDKKPKRSLSLPPLEVTSNSTVFNRLSCGVLDPYSLPSKPDFVSNPSKYFTYGLGRLGSPRFRSLPELADTKKLKVNAKFDEKSLFPKSILDAELKLRTAKTIAAQSKQWNKTFLRNTSLKARQKPLTNQER